MRSLYEQRLTGALRAKRAKGNIYVLDGNGRVLQGNGQIEQGTFLLETLGVSQTERAELSLHLACGARETVLLCGKHRPVFVNCGLYACTGLLVAYVPSGTVSADMGATLARLLEDVVVGSNARSGEREVDAEVVAAVTLEYALLQAATGRGLCTPSARVEAISRLTGCGILYELVPLERDETDAMLMLQALLLLAALRAMRVGLRSLSFCTLRDHGRAVLSLEMRDQTPDEALDVFDSFIGMARARGDLFALTRDLEDPCRLHLTATLTRAELSFQGVKEPDGTVRKEPLPLPVALTGKDGELVL